MIPRTVPDPEDRVLLKDKHPHYIAGWNKVKHQHHPRPNRPVVHTRGRVQDAKATPKTP